MAMAPSGSSMYQSAQSTTRGRPDPLLSVGPRAPSLSGCVTAAALGGQAACFAPLPQAPF